MSNLAQYRLSLGLFSIGLLWLVSEAVGEDRRPGPLDSATTSITHRLQVAAAADNDNDQGDPGYELAVTQALPDTSAQGTHPHSAWAVSADGDGDDAVAADDDEVAPADYGAAELPPENVGIIHK